MMLNSRWLSGQERATVAREAREYFATFCRASRMQKYTAASVSRGYRPIPSASMRTGSGALPTCACRAAVSPWSASTGG